MEVCRRSSWLLLLLGVSLLATALQGVQGEVESEGPSESECRPYIEKALKELETGEAAAEAPDEGIAPTAGDDSKEEIPTVEITTDDDDSNRQDDGDGDSDDDTHEDSKDDEQDDNKESVESTEDSVEDDGEKNEAVEEEEQSEQEVPQEEESSESRGKRSVDEDTDTKEESEEEGDATAAVSAEDDEGQKTDGDSGEDEPGEQSPQADSDSKEDQIDSKESDQEGKSEEGSEEKPEEKSGEESDGDLRTESVEDQDSKEDDDKPSAEAADDETGEDSKEGDTTEEGASQEGPGEEESVEGATDDDGDSKEAPAQTSQEDDTKEDDTNESEDKNESKEGDDSKEVIGGGESKEESEGESKEGDDNDTKEDEDDSKARSEEEAEAIHVEGDEKSVEQADETPEDADGETKEVDSETKEVDSKESKEDEEAGVQTESTENAESADEEGQSDSKEDEQQSASDEDDSAPEEELSLDVEIPTDLRPRQHVEQLLKLDEESSEAEKIINRIADITLRELKKLHENAIKPLEVLYKYRDLSNRHFGDSEIFSKPLILFMGPWSGGKSSIINYLLDNEYNETSLRTGAEPSPAYFNILMYGDEPEVVDGTQLAADFTFSGLQKFGQGLEERLRGVKLPNKLLEKVNIVEIPGILEVRKQVSRVFPFNDACQWFIDRADIIFLVYDPSKLDVGPETEAILDQLKGREHQTRIILNKADQVKPEELMRVQGALIWNISPLMSSAQPPVMYTTSLWSRPYEPWAPVKLLQAQERAFLRDLRTAVDKRIENKIASARRFAVRVRNHAKMVDCYLTTYYNHKSLFGNRKQVADAIIEHPQNYHIYEGLSTLTNISRYDLPDPEVYRDFFKLNPLYEFQQLSATCTYFRGCPINRLDIAIAYDLPELVGKHKRLVEAALTEANQQQKSVPGS